MQRQILKDHLLLGKQQKIVDTFKAINATIMREGVGRMQDSQFDQLVITRIVNYPELVYNQRCYNDSKPKNRFFVKDGMQKWSLSKGNDCILCDKHKLTMIFYERGEDAKNSDLIEINDPVFLNELKEDFINNYSTYGTLTPLICGTVVKKPYGIENFSRKLKMIRAPIFTLLCISGSALFIEEKKQTQTTKSATIRYMEFDDNTVLENLMINQKLTGWQHIVDDKCNNNELTDVHAVNAPNFNEDIEDKGYFIYATFLPPGYHQMLIYDPDSRRAFTKDIIVGMNHKDFYPEYPIL